MTKKIDKENKPLEINLNTNLNSIWADNFTIDIREDNICLIRFLTGLPEGIFEQARIMTSKEDLKKFIDALCQVSTYYPIKKEKKGAKKTTKK
ncbi:MAG: hypothetical protein JRF20_01995 [Deltaproteobacteria bacterium]|nr:hypothetical protein [Deltaproteobacteria bacterium]MBW1964460.1 hypothetical protein [Deltaproteobacteria bacterium]MBW2080452.1 hypothetical protein [Deltaproteobacteria bacterium]MBW2349951.1 hypothetical protein [Deltaproteobacteria bacterium]